MNHKTKYLVGKKAKLKHFIEPFNSSIINFLNDFSKELNKNKKIQNYPDLKALSFFCREKNILIFKKKYNSPSSIRYGLGLLFHITPSNIPTNFAYSLIFGLISGNSNIIKVPSKKFVEIDLICKCLNITLKLKRYSKIKDMIAIIRYSDNNEITKKLSLMCDGRLIWGGDKTVKTIKKFDTKSKNIDIPFSDRYSIALINSDYFLKLPEYKKRVLILNFYNDTYNVDQNACSSPHIVLWYGNYFLKAKEIFWSKLNELVKKKYNPPLISSIDSYAELASNLIKNNNIKSYKIFNPSLYVITLNNIKSQEFLEKTKWGFFYEYKINNLIDIEYLVKKKLQTLTYTGFTKKYLSNFFRKYNFNGIDRVVPIGQALNINLIWDGYDMIKLLSREIEIR